MFGEGKRHDLAAVALLCLIAIFTVSCRRAPTPTIAELYQQAEASLRQENSREAVTLCDRALAMAPSDDMRWRLRLLKSEAVMNLGDTQGSLAMLTPGAPGDSELLARQKMLLGNNARRRGEDREAEVFLTDAARIAQPLDNARLRSQIALYRGVLYLREEKYPVAEADFRSALEAARTAGDTYLIASAMGDLAVLKQNQLSLEEALYWFEQVRRSFVSMGARASAAAALGNHGWCLGALGQVDEALKELATSAEEAHAAGDVDAEMDREQNMGNLLMERGDNASATAHLERALQLAAPRGDHARAFDALTNLAELAVRQHDWSTAGRRRAEAEQHMDRVADPNSAIVLRYLDGRILAGRGDVVRGQHILTSVASEESSDPLIALDAHLALAELYEEGRQQARAEGEFRAAIHYMDASSTRVVDPENRLAYLDRVNRFYRRYVSFLIRAGRAEDALVVADASRARMLTGGAGVNGRVPKAAEFRKAASSAKAVLLSYWLAQDQSYVWVVDARHIQIIPLAPEQEFRRMVESYSRFIQDQGDPLNSEQNAGRQLYEHLVRPVLPFAEGKKRFVIVSDGVLHSLNFETLPAAGNLPHFFIDDAVVSVTPSLAFLSQTHPQSRHGADSLLMIGDPVSPGQDFPRLQNASKEMRFIESLFAPENRTVIARDQATPGAYQGASPGRFSLIHFIAHSLPEREQPLESALILSPHDNQYRLSARTISTIPLRARLVTLSACRGAGVRTYSGEGSVGLAWAFLHAGAGSVVAGLWDVDDTSTAALMAAFYAHLREGKSSVEALHEAKLERLHAKRALQKPYYWGAFQVFAGPEN